MNIGKAIKLCRTQKNLKQNEIAKLANISIGYLSLLEQGKRDPNFSTLENIAKALNIPLSIIIFLAANDQNELPNLSQELKEKLSYTALSLIKESQHDNAHLPAA